MENPVVSVCIISYNHENYISTCLSSILNQKVNFQIEIIIGDDCSTDRTRDIINEYHHKYPNIIKPLFHQNNLGGGENLKQCYLNARGKYIVHLDGDDFALEGKLQTQYEILEKNVDCMICCHDVFRMIDNDLYDLNVNLKISDGVYDLYDYLKELPLFAHSSKMFRNLYNKDFYDFINSKTLDFEIHYHQIKLGNVYFINKKLGVYRVDVGFSSKSTLSPAFYSALKRVYSDAITNVLDNNRKRDLNKYFSRKILSYSYKSALLNDSKGCLYYALESLKVGYISFLQLGFLIISFVPSIMHNVALYFEKRKYIKLNNLK